MNRNELIADFKLNKWVAVIDSPVNLNHPHPNIDLYELPFLEVGTRTAIVRTVHVYVVNEDTEEEVAYFKDRLPKPTIKETNPLLEQYSNAIAYLKGHVVEENENFIMVEAVIDSTDNKVKKVLYYADADGYKLVDTEVI